MTGSPRTSQLPPRTRPLRVGHKGADLLATGNTLQSFRAAVDAGVDMIEFDVLSEHTDGSGRLLLAHDYESLHEGSPLTLEQGLAHLSAEEFAGVEFDVDVKIPGYGRRVIEALRDVGLIERSLVSCTYTAELDAMRALEPALRLGWSVPRLRRDYTTDMLTAIPALVILSGYRALLPRRAREALQAGRFDAIMAHWRLVTKALVRAVADGGGQLYAWTVDDAAQIARLSAMGVDAIITDAIDIVRPG